MIGGTNFSIPRLLRSKDQAEIFRRQFKIDPDLSKRYHSIFREDVNPGCRFEVTEGILFFVDNRGFKGKLFFNAYDCLRNVGYNHYDAIEIISECGDSTLQVQKSDRSVIKIQATPFTEENQFSKYGLPAEFLNNDIHTYNVTKYSISIDAGMKIYNNPCVGYVCNEHVKLRTDTGHITNFDVNDIMNVGYLNKFSKERIGIVKSKKESLIVEYYLRIPSLVVYNEEVMLPSWAIDIVRTYDDVFCFMDNDPTGKAMSAKYRKEFGFRTVEISEAKNISDLIELRGLDYSLKELKRII